MKPNQDKNIIVVKHVLSQIFKNRNFSSYDDIVAPDAKVHCPSSWQAFHPTVVSTREAIKKIDEEYARAFHMLFVSIETIMAAEDKVVVVWHGDGAHEGDFYHLQASYRKFSLRGQTVFQLGGDSRIHQVWQSWDMLALLSQICDVAVTPARSGCDVRLEKFKRLSPREKECLKYLLYGMTSRESAEEMGLSPRTVEYYFENIKDKMDCTTKRDLYALCRLLEKHEGSITW